MKKVLFIALLILVATATAADDDEVDYAKIGYPTDLNFKVYSGFFDINKDSSQLVHYAFMTS